MVPFNENANDKEEEKPDPAAEEEKKTREMANQWASALGMNITIKEVDDKKELKKDLLTEKGQE